MARRGVEDVDADTDSDSSSDSWLVDRARLAGFWIIGRAKDVGNWFVSQAKGLWIWTKDHPILATMIVAVITVAVLFPVLYVVLPLLPHIGGVVTVLLASKWVVPIIMGLTAAFAAVSAAFIYTAVYIFKKLFGAPPGAPGAAGGAAKMFGDGLNTSESLLLKSGKNLGDGKSLKNKFKLDPNEGDFEIVDPEFEPEPKPKVVANDDVADDAVMVMSEGNELSARPVTNSSSVVELLTEPATELSTELPTSAVTLQSDADADDSANVKEVTELFSSAQHSFATSPHSFHKRSLSDAALINSKSVTTSVVGQSAQEPDTDDECQYHLQQSAK